MSTLTFRKAAVEDAAEIAVLNQQLIHDEGHRNRMTLRELTSRMQGWLQGEYEAIVIHDPLRLVGYALFRCESDHVYVRQFFVIPECRRQGIGRAALAWMWSNVWTDVSRLRLDVLVGNTPGREFWNAVGFSDYCITMEALRPGPSAESTAFGR